MRKKLENFDVMLGDIAITKSKRRNVWVLEVAYTEDDTIRALFTYPECEMYSGNLPRKDLPHVIEKVKNARRFWEKK